MSLVEVANLSVAFATAHGALTAVDRISFHIEAGETVALVGESGSGKSATALALMRLLSEPPARVMADRIVIDGSEVLNMNTRALRRMRGGTVAMVFQDPMTSLDPVMSIGAQIVEPLRRHTGLPRSEAKSRAIALLRQVGIPDANGRINDYPHQFSGGMRQRVMIAMALSCSPKLILADEITTALDVTVQAQVLEVLRDLSAGSGTALLLISHDLAVVAGLAQRVLVMYAGQLVEVASTVELFRNPQMPYTWGLLSSAPTLDMPKSERLRPIDGVAPTGTGPRDACQFAPRCAYARAICKARSPALALVSTEHSGHLTRCWGTQTGPEGGWLRGYDWRIPRGSSC